MRIKVVVLPIAILSALQMMAGALAPCVKATSSADGNFLVVSSMEMQPGSSDRVQRVTVDVVAKERFINAKDRIISRNVFWSGRLWSVVLNRDDVMRFEACPLALITNDGEFIVIVSQHVLEGDNALHIWRRRDHLGDPLREGPDHGIGVKDIPLNQLWPAGKLSEARVMTDGTPQWFAGGTFEFSADSRTLIHKTRWGTTVHIRLSDGSVSAD